MSRRRRPAVAAATIAVACTIGAFLTGFVPADADTINAADAVAAIRDIAPAAVVDSTGTTVNTDSETAAVSSSHDNAIMVPNDAADGIQLTNGERALVIGLPYAGQAGEAAESPVPGVVVYDNNNDSSTVPVIQDGAVQVNTVIHSGDAPRQYAYPLELPEGQSLQLNADGSVIAAGSDGTVSAYMPAPWAKDAEGKAVPTWYVIHGTTLTQVVGFTTETVFPVVADPKFEWYWGLPTVKTTRAETAALMTAATAGKMCAQVGKVAGGAGVTLCALNLASIIVNSQRAYWQGQCARLMFGPGVVSTIPYKDGYCR